MLKNLSFYNEETKSVKKEKRKTSNISVLSELPFFPKKLIKLTIKQLSDVLPFPPKRPRRLKRLTKHQILENKLPFYDSAGILEIY